jgi:hypothetical protein
MNDILMYGMIFASPQSDVGSKRPPTSDLFGQSVDICGVVNGRQGKP